MWRDDIFFVVMTFLLVFILIIIFIVLQICKSQKRSKDFARHKAFVRDSIRRRSQIIDKFNLKNENELVPKNNLTNFDGLFQPETVKKSNAFNQKLINTKKALDPIYAENETLYDNFSSASLYSDFCNAQTHSCCSTESISIPTSVTNQTKNKKNFQKDYSSDLTRFKFVFFFY